MGDAPRVLVIACGALAREIAALRAGERLAASRRALPARGTAQPARSASRPPCATPSARIATATQTIFVAYGDCGTGGALDAVLREENVERIPGAHCYEFFAGSAAFAALADDEPGTFYLTDFLLRHFDRLVIRGLGLDRHPELAPQYFGNYRRLVYLAQVDAPERIAAARAAAERLGLEFAYRVTGYGGSGARACRVRPSHATMPAWQS